MSPSSAGSPPPSPGPWSTLPSSIGKASTSVGPSPSIQRWLSSVMYSTSTRRIDSSASGLTPISSRACRATVRMVSALTSAPDSLAISMDKVPAPGSVGLAPPAGPAAVRVAIGHRAHRLLGFLRRVPTCVGVDDVADQPVAHDIGATQLGEMDIFDAVKDVTDHPQAAAGAPR